MTLAMLFNERSLRQSAPDRQSARLWMTEFVKLLITATSPDYGLDVLRTHATFAEMMLSPDYPMMAWFNDSEVSKDAQEFVLNYATRHPVIKPYIEDLPIDDATRLRSDRFIGSYENDVAIGLGFAYLLDGLAISLISEPCWDMYQIQIRRLEELIDADDLIEDVVDVRHSARAAHLAIYKDWIAERNKNSVRDGKDLLRKAKRWYPHLVFAPSAEKQLAALGRADIHLARIVERLFDLEKSYSHWIGGGYDVDSLLQGASHESTATIQEHGKLRTFKDRNGVDRLCEMHLKSLPDHWRIHFWSDNDNDMNDPAGRKFLVGYIGKHLDISG